MNSMGNKSTFNNKVNYVPYDEREHTEARREARWELIEKEISPRTQD